MAGSRRILLVDEEVSMRRALAPVPAFAGLDVAVAGTGTEALTSIELDPPDLIVLDLGLPDIDGMEVCRPIRETRTIPIIVRSKQRDR